MRDEKLKEITNVITEKISRNDGNINEKSELNTESIKLKRPQSLNLSYIKNAQEDSKQKRTDPDGGNCEVEEELVILNNAEMRLQSQENLTSKKGWLTKLDNISKVWTKHWFYLKSGGLFYYRDPNAEKRGVLDGILDVHSIQEINEISTNRDHAFQLKVSFHFQFFLA